MNKLSPLLLSTVLCFSMALSVSYATEKGTLQQDQSPWYTVIPPIKEQIKEYQDLYKDSIEKGIDLRNEHMPQLFPKIKQAFTLCEAEIQGKVEKKKDLSVFWEEALSLLENEDFTLVNYKKQIVRLLCLVGNRSQLVGPRLGKDYHLNNLLENKWKDLKNYGKEFEEGNFSPMRGNSFYDAILFTPGEGELKISTFLKLIFDTPVPLGGLAFSLKGGKGHNKSFADSLGFFMHDEFHVQEMAKFFSHYPAEFSYYKTLKDIYLKAKAQLKNTHPQEYKKVKMALFLLVHEFNISEFESQFGYEEWGYYKWMENLHKSYLATWESFMRSFPYNLGSWLLNQNIERPSRFHNDNDVRDYLISFINNLSSSISLSRYKVENINDIHIYQEKPNIYSVNLDIKEENDTSAAKQSNNITLNLMLEKKRLPSEKAIEWAFFSGSRKKGSLSDPTTLSKALQTIKFKTRDSYFFWLKDHVHLISSIGEKKIEYLGPLQFQEFMGNYLKSVTPIVEKLYSTPQPTTSLSGASNTSISVSKEDKKPESSPLPIIDFSSPEASVFPTIDFSSPASASGIGDSKSNSFVLPTLTFSFPVSVPLTSPSRLSNSEVEELDSKAPVWLPFTSPLPNVVEEAKKESIPKQAEDPELIAQILRELEDESLLTNKNDLKELQ